MAKRTDTTSQAPEAILAELALRHFGIVTLAIRNSDSPDYHDVAVWAIRDALEAAYQAGRNAGASRNGE